MKTMSSEAFPNLVASDYPSRMIGCVCEPEADAINWMELTKGDPVKCYCGHWFQLVDYEEYFRRTAKTVASRQVSYPNSIFPHMLTSFARKYNIPDIFIIIQLQTFTISTTLFTIPPKAINTDHVLLMYKRQH
ncbi:hypothetical protein AHF37_06894 [Paragonimus kellicotti]|nr:hypothetical protein AHF37_06894 [Paragonimus kellicotti]